MKKLIFGCALMLCGVMGGTGWLMAAVSLAERGAWSTVLNVFDFSRAECCVILLFYALAVFGAYLGIKALKENA